MSKKNFGFQYQTYISYVKDTHQILFGFASRKLLCPQPGFTYVHITIAYVQTVQTVQPDRRTEICFCLFCVHSSKVENFFFINAIRWATVDS